MWSVVIYSKHQLSRMWLHILSGWSSVEASDFSPWLLSALHGRGRLLLPHGSKSRVLLEHALQLLELLDGLHLVPSQPLLKNLRPEHGLALVAFKLSFITLHVVTAALHLRPALPQLVLLLLEASLDDLSTVREPLAEVRGALLRHQLCLERVKLHEACVLVLEVHKVWLEDIHLGGLLFLLLLLGALTQALHAGALTCQVVDGWLKHIVAAARDGEVTLLASLDRSHATDANLILAPARELLLRPLVRLHDDIPAVRLHLKQFLHLRLRGLGQTSGQATQIAVLVDVGTGTIGELPRLPVVVHTDLALGDEVADLVNVLVGRGLCVASELLSHLADGYLTH
mmetsp:Transcript_102205/g.184350  ORF Transcript_102205/g.184350 Transcript_102205/m.184350 type:complete len:342 (-) Transcript_102205:1409-2434(-)